MHITTAMQRSVRRGVSDIFFDSLLGRRGTITDDVTSVKDSFSSWDNCMNASYCKWPAIAIIVIAGLFIFSVLWCIIRCACCGMSCCCSCFSFLSCCDCCGGSCDGKKNKPHKYLDDPHDPRNAPGGGPNQGYQAPAPMMGGALNSGPPQTAGLITSRDMPSVPQYAQFEVGKNGLYVEPKPAALSDDALPPMPSWDTAASKKVMTEEEKNAVELSNLEPATSQNKALMTGAVSPVIGRSTSPAATPYGQPDQGMGGNGYMGVAPQSRSPVNGQNGYMGVPPQSRSPINGQNGFNNAAMGGYRGGPSPGPGRGMQGPGRGGPMPGYGGPGQDMNNGFGGNYGAAQNQDQYENNKYAGVPIGNGYGRQQPQRQYSGANNGQQNFPAQPTRQYSDDSTRPLNPGRQYSDNSYDGYTQNPPPRGPSRGPGPGPQQGPQRMISPGPVNSGGFDFGSGSQPQQQHQQRRRPVPQSQPSRDDYMGYGGSTAPPTYASRSPPPQEPGYPGYKAYTAPAQEPSYPGFKPYSPPPQQTVGRVGTPDALTPGGGGGGGGGRGREPRNWDPVQQ